MKLFRLSFVFWLTCAGLNKHVDQIDNIERVVQRDPQHSELLIQVSERVTSGNEEKIVGHSQGDDRQPIVQQRMPWIDDETRAEERDHIVVHSARFSRITFDNLHLE